MSDKKQEGDFAKISFLHGEMAERLNAAVLKTVIPRDGNRGFESPSLLKQKIDLIFIKQFFVFHLTPIIKTIHGSRLFFRCYFVNFVEIPTNLACLSQKCYNKNKLNKGDKGGGSIKLLRSISFSV